jgi:FMN-dependent oxidoreductase (nitrilotriacetate monooxygenase family)
MDRSKEAHMVGRRNDKMVLGAFFHPTGHHVAAWLHPGSQVDAGVNFKHYVELAQAAEGAKFDLIFLADESAVRQGRMEALSRWPQYMAYFEPTTLLSALAAVTTRIGLVATSTTSYNEPYSLARRYASLDHISQGRAGWNVVTSGNAAESLNFGRDQHYEHQDRYERAREFVDVVRGLWDSWDDDAFVRDRATARYFDPDKLHVLNHKAKYFSVKGPLNIARPPQGHPVIVQAGSSEVGKVFAAETADVVFTLAQSLSQAKGFYNDVKGRMAAFGRSPHHLKILPGLNPIIGRSEAEAEEKYEQLQSMIHPDVGLEVLSTAFGGFKFSGLPLDGPLPDIPMNKNASQGHQSNALRMAREENLTIRQLYQRYAGARGNRTVKGTPAQIVDQMEEWFLNEGVDGFLIQPPYLPGGLHEFIDLVVPELRRRGLVRTEYEGRTLRDHLGLPRPAGRYQPRTVEAKMPAQ